MTRVAVEMTDTGKEGVSYCSSLPFVSIYGIIHLMFGRFTQRNLWKSDGYLWINRLFCG